MLQVDTNNVNERTQTKGMSSYTQSAELKSLNTYLLELKKMFAVKILDTNT